MTVEELIIELQKQNPQASVVVYIEDWGHYAEVEGVFEADTTSSRVCLDV